MAMLNNQRVLSKMHTQVCFETSKKHACSNQKKGKWWPEGWERRDLTSLCTQRTPIETELLGAPHKDLFVSIYKISFGRSWDFFV